MSINKRIVNPDFGGRLEKKSKKRYSVADDNQWITLVCI